MQTISELELSLQIGLEALRNAQLTEEATSALELLLPDGLTPVVELVNENFRRKRSSAASWNWNPQSDRVVISFRAASTDALAEPRGASSARRPSESLPIEMNSRRDQPAQPKVNIEPVTDQTISQGEIADQVIPQEIVECCQALASAEKSNRQFIALKWFRDDFLATVDYPWAKSPQRRQRVLSQTIEMGRIEAKKIHNPKAPQFPTTTITLNRSVPTPGVPPRFQPITIRGESASATLLRDRGVF